MLFNPLTAIALFTIIPSALSHPEGLSLSPLNPRTTCPVNRKVCGTTCCPTDATDLGGVRYYCRNASKNLCCKGSDTDSNGICCPNQPPYVLYANCGGSCCYGTCNSFVTGIGLNQRRNYFCASAPVPLCPSDPSLACGAGGDCSKVTGPTSICKRDGCCERIS